MIEKNPVFEKIYNSLIFKKQQLEKAVEQKKRKLEFVREVLLMLDMGKDCLRVVHTRPLKEHKNMRPPWMGEPNAIR